VLEACIEGYIGNESKQYEQMDIPHRLSISLRGFIIP